MKNSVLCAFLATFLYGGIVAGDADHIVVENDAGKKVYVGPTKEQMVVAQSFLEEQDNNTSVMRTLLSWINPLSGFPSEEDFEQ